jgi:hypothetical protein
MKNPFRLKKEEQNEKDGSTERPDFIKKITSYFNPEPQKEKVLRREDFTAAGDTYYATVSAGYKVSQRILIIILAVSIDVRKYLDKR